MNLGKRGHSKVEQKVQKCGTNMKNLGINVVKVFLTGLNENEMFFCKRKLTSTGIVFI